MRSRIEYRRSGTGFELAGKAPQQGPAWYVVLTAFVGLIQFGIALAMLAGYRKSRVGGKS
jgi:hypothetical protein